MLMVTGRCRTGQKLLLVQFVEKRFTDSLGIDNTNKMLSVALSKSQHQVYTKAWRAALPYGNSYSKMQILGAAVKIYAKSPRLLVSAIKTIMQGS